MEMEKIPEAGYAIKGLWIAGLQRTLTLRNLLFPLKLISSLLVSRSIIKNFKPDAAIGTGGYASAPLLKMASIKGIPCLIQEQNSHAGITNKWLSSNVQRICTAYNGMEQFFPASKIQLTGNPVRQDLLNVHFNKAAAVAFFNLKPKTKTVLVLGGSLGAKKINELIDAQLPYFKEQGVQVLWQCGKVYAEKYGNRTQGDIQVYPFLNRMDLAYAVADIIISRAGALSVSELCLVGKPVIFIPSPNVAEDHQTKNALSISQENAAILLKEEDAAAQFEGILDALIQDQVRQRELGAAILALAKPNATKEIVDEIEKLIQAKV
ncbi:MAG: UDP-N-acetylglucosamine--N-acetylmuramyl-(pentapeptide) pyrophosphoryl-undecaprenol N-acetylglucosamine transferase [Saprospiraceae bacterium]|jgi:UDP-N-acetylglucosamine--N-acetylmuramyl-(pentapeptide) pyrophosphoryl-undecaprenol N-acetylglucosamine transferase